MSGSLTHTPAQVIQQLLDDLSLASLPSSGQGVSDWPVWSHVMPDNPDNAICVYDTVGEQNGRSMIDGTQWLHYGLSLLVRSLTPETAFTKANAIKIGFDTSVNQTSVTISSSTYLIQSITTKPGPFDAGFEQSDAMKTRQGSKRRLYSVNAVVDLKQTA